MSVLPFLTAGCLAPLFAARIRRRDSSAMLLIVALTTGAIGVAGICSMFVDWQAGWVLITALPLLCLAAWLPQNKSGIDRTLAFFSAHRRVRGWTIAVLSLLITIGGLEWTVFMLDRAGVVTLEQPLRTMLQKGNEDWRQASIADSTREPDPVLFWRPRATPPYNAQRFQGPIAEVPKPRDVFRIFCYGDSNTDGHTGDGGWPLRLARLLAERNWPKGRRAEVINAGVMGYSSYQGLMRCREEIGTYKPDLILVSFGWNDAPEAVGKPDNEFEIPAAAVVWLQRTLLRFRSYQLCRSLYRQTAGTTPETIGPRVKLRDYAANLDAFRRLGAQHSATVVLLTRPHRESATTLAMGTGWRTTIPTYNAVPLDLAETANATCIDVREHFADAADLFCDECHFTAKGHERMAAFLLEELRRLFGE